MTKTTIPKPKMLKVTMYQLAILLLLTGTLSLEDRLLALSALVGGMIQIIPQAWFSWQAFKYAGARQVGLAVRSMYRGEFGKVVLTAALFAVVFNLETQWNYIALFAAFLLMIPLQLFVTKRALEH
ncbi:MAG: ATP synthase subunit I [Porticoccaceae bacterium]|jgi:ATP synthase protein I|tara:strand:+ start:164 stop:541 length:378 start_codon:yes stop_codon:yes gene_type:complete